METMRTSIHRTLSIPAFADQRKKSEKSYLFKKFLVEQRQYLHRCEELVPQDRDDYPILAGQIEELHQIACQYEQTSLAHLEESMEQQKKQHDALLRQYRAEDYRDLSTVYTIVGQNVTLSECIDWLKNYQEPVAVPDYGLF